MVINVSALLNRLRSAFKSPGSTIAGRKSKIYRPRDLSERKVVQVWDRVTGIDYYDV